MGEKMSEVYEMYDVQPEHIGRGRGAMVLHTDKGIRQVRAVTVSESRLAAEYEFKERLCEAGYTCTDRLVKNTDGDLVTYDRYGNPFAMRMYFEGREMNVQNRQEILLAVDNLVELHRAGREAWKLSENDMQLREKNDLRRRNRELKRIIHYVSKQSPKREFEALYMKAFPYFYAQGLACEKMEAGEGSETQPMTEAIGTGMTQSLTEAIGTGMTQPVTEAIGTGVTQPLTETIGSDKTQPLTESGENREWQADRHIGYCHGSYNYHSVLFCTGEGQPRVATINFDRFQVGNQLQDLYYFMRKTVEKNGYSFELLTAILQQYHKGIPLGQEDFGYIYGLYRYPEKFYKLSNQYMNSNKNRISPKMIEKLNRIIEEEEKKQALLEKMHIFASHLQNNLV